MRRTLKRLWKSADGAVAPTVALSLVGLLAAGGIAFDYAHMAALDTELQNAADQAALAAASQLDGSTDACKRAGAAASNLLANSTLFANDGGARGITVPNEAACDATGQIRFYQSYNQTTDTPGDEAKTDADAKVVIVQVNGRTAYFALTPIVGALSSGTLDAEAVASLSSAVCKVPPMMICIPSTNTDFPTSADVGKGLLLQPGPSTGAWVPGNYGYLDFGNGASGLKINLAINQESAGCYNNTDGIDTEPGNKASVNDYLNTRFDLYANPLKKGDCSTGTGDYCPSQNTRKDLVRTETVDVDGTSGTVPPRPACGAAGANVSDFTQGADTKGFPRDNCHINGTCGNFGDATWDRAAYFASIHSSDNVSTVAASLGKTSATLSRWDVYKWELADKANRLKAILTNPTDAPSFKPKNKNSASGTYTFTNKCAYPYPVNGTGVAASATQKDRRVLTIAAVDCTGMNGKSAARVKRFVDVFLVEPSLGRTTPYATGNTQIYGEVIGAAAKPNGENAFQYYLRQRPRLLK
ncbi:Flp pilus assembly protein TadG [Sphingomonas sp. F9_3S_D5_B_2]